MVLVPLHIDSAPLLDVNDESASSNECELFKSNMLDECGGTADLWLEVRDTGGLPLRPRGGDGVRVAPNCPLLAKKFGSSSSLSSGYSSWPEVPVADVRGAFEGSSRSLSCAILTCRMTFATSKGCAMTTLVYFHTA